MAGGHTSVACSLFYIHRPLAVYTCHLQQCIHAMILLHTFWMHSSILHSGRTTAVKGLTKDIQLWLSYDVSSITSYAIIISCTAIYCPLQKNLMYVLLAWVVYATCSATALSGWYHVTQQRTSYCPARCNSVTESRTHIPGWTLDHWLAWISKIKLAYLLCTCTCACSQSTLWAVWRQGSMWWRHKRDFDISIAAAESSM